MDSRSLDFGDEVLRRTGGRRCGCDPQLSARRGHPAGAMATLADYGRFLEIGKRRDIYQERPAGAAAVPQEPVVLRDRPRPRDPGNGRLSSARMLHCFDIVRRVGDGDLRPLPHCAWPITEGVDALRFMQHGKHIGKVVLKFSDQPVATVPAEDEPVTFRADASYLITGGLGGFGLGVARWMAERGARHPRPDGGARGADTPGGPARRSLRTGAARRPGRRPCRGCVEGGRRRHSVGRDRTRLAAAARRLARGDRSCAEDALLINLDRDQMDRAAGPEAVRYLEPACTRRPPPARSISSSCSHHCQAYSATRARVITRRPMLFLDAMAFRYRRMARPAGAGGQLGLPRRRRLSRPSIRAGRAAGTCRVSWSFTVRQALALLEKAMQRQHVQVSVMRVEWSRWRGLGVTGRVSPRFAHLCGQADGGHGRAVNGALPARDTILAADPAGRPGLLGPTSCSATRWLAC